MKVLVALLAFLISVYAMYRAGCALAEFEWMQSVAWLLVDISIALSTAVLRISLPWEKQP